MRGPYLLRLASLDTLLQTLGAKKVGRFLPYDLIRREAANHTFRCLFPGWYHVVYHAKRSNHFRARARSQQARWRVKHNHEQLSGTSGNLAQAADMFCD